MMLRCSRGRQTLTSRSRLAFHQRSQQVRCAIYNRSSLIQARAQQDLVVTLFADLDVAPVQLVLIDCPYPASFDIPLNGCGRQVGSATRSTDRRPRRHRRADGSSTTKRSASHSSSASRRSVLASSRRTKVSAARFPNSRLLPRLRATSAPPPPRSRTSASSCITPATNATPLGKKARTTVPTQHVVSTD